MGMSQAKHIVLNDEGMNRAYQKEFLNQYQAGLDNYFDQVPIHSSQDIRQAYRDYASSTSKPEIGSHYREVQSRAYKDGFIPYQEKESMINQEISNLNSQVNDLSNNQQALQTEDNIMNFGNELSGKVKNEQNKNVIVKNLEEVRNSTLGQYSSGHEEK